jgi:hypothetical protein
MLKDNCETIKEKYIISALSSVRKLLIRMQRDIFQARRDLNAPGFWEPVLYIPARCILRF